MSAIREGCPSDQGTSEVGQTTDVSSDVSDVLYRWREGEAWSDWRRISLDKLQELMDRANAKFGDPTKDLGGPNAATDEPPRQRKQRVRKKKRA